MNNKDFDFSKIYLDWLKKNINQHKVNSFTTRITLPFLDRNNDHIEMYIVDKKDGTFLLTDDGMTIDELKFSGFELKNSPRRTKIFDSILRNHGVIKTENDELTITATLSEFPIKKHMLAQCMMKISDMFYLSKSNVKSLFVEDVQKFFDQNKIAYVKDFIFNGKSRLPAYYDFVIPHSAKKPERLIKVVNNLDTDTAKNILFSWIDVKETRDKYSQLYTFIQDEDKKVSSKAIDALKEYDICPALWTRKNDFVQELSA